MAGQQLHEYSLDLCDYVLGQLRPHLRTLPTRPQPPLPELDYDGFHRLTLAEWLGWGVASLPAPLADHVWAGVTGDKILLPLNDRELFALTSVVDDPPIRCEDDARWEPFPGLHRRAVEYVCDIRSRLTEYHVEEWARDSAAFGDRLCEEGLSLADGVATVHEWLWCVRRLLQAMGAAQYLPAPTGFHPTPTIPVATAAPPSDLDITEERFAEVLGDLRKAISDLPEGRAAKPDTVVEQAMVQRTIGRLVLRWLEARGEYSGFTRKKPARYRRGE